MSWDAYVDTSLVGSGNLDKAAIFSADGSSVWASSKGFNVTADEVKHIVSIYKDFSKAFESGFRIAGDKYFAIKAEGRSLYGKKGKTGIIIVKTKQALLIGHHDEEQSEHQNSGNAAKTVEGLADYLEGVGY